MVGGLPDLAESGWFEKGYRILFFHLGGIPSSMPTPIGSPQPIFGRALIDFVA